MSPAAVKTNVALLYPVASCDSNDDQENLKESVKSTYSATSNGIGCNNCAFSNVQVSMCMQCCTQSDTIFVW